MPSSMHATHRRSVRFSMPGWHVLCLALVCTGLLDGCSSTAKQPVQVVDRNTGAAGTQRSQPAGGQYIVQRGDTMYSIAFRFGWDWKALAARNNIPPPYVIRPGQIVRFDSIQSTSTRPAAVPASKPSSRPVTPVAVQPAPQSTAVQPVTQAARPVGESKQAAPVQQAASAPVLTPVNRSSTGWAWPAQGAVIGRFSSNGSLNKGIDIAGELGQPVLAAQDGTVVYAGSGLRGYGELVIIKHSDIYVSAYGHNRSLLVREGQKVKAGQVIADMGSTGADRVKLHFEIRRQGKPVDPLQYLPSR